MRNIKMNKKDILLNVLIYRKYNKHVNNDNI
jgi:hypothetical protein